MLFIIAAECDLVNDVAFVSVSSNNDEGMDESDDSVNARTLVRLFNGLERQALSVQDVTLAVASLRVLSSLATGSALVHRCSSTAWALTCTLHTQHTSLLPHLLSSAGMNNERGVVGQAATSDGNLHLPGTDSLWPRLAALVNPMQWPALGAMETELFGRGNAIDGDGKATKAAWKGLRLLAIAPVSSGSGPRLDSLPPSRSAQEVFFFRLFWSSWWASEVPAERIHGIMFLLHEIFRVHLLAGIDVFRDQAIAQDIELGRNKNASANVAHNKDGRTRNGAKVGAKGGQASTISGLAMSSLSGPTFDTTMTAAVFPTLSIETLEPIFTIAISSFPALFLFAQPSSLPCSDPLVDSVASNPYQTFLSVTRGYMWLLRRLEAVLVDGTQMQFLLRVSTLCVRVCKAALLSVEVAVAHAIAWRSRQRSRSTAHPSVAKAGGNSVARGHMASANDEEDLEAHNNDDESGCEEEENDSHMGDNGSLEHVAVLLDWALALTHAVIHFSETLKSTFLFHDSNGNNKKSTTRGSSTASRGRRSKSPSTFRIRGNARSSSAFVVPKELSRSTPQLQFAAERLAARLLRSAKTLSMRLRDPEAVVVGNAWEKESIRRAIKFNQLQKACVQKPETTSAWRPEAPPGQCYDDCEGVDGGDIFDLRSGRVSETAADNDSRKIRSHDKSKTGTRDDGEGRGIDDVRGSGKDKNLRTSNSSWERARARVTSQLDDDHSDSLSGHDDTSDDDDDEDDEGGDAFEFVARTKSRRSSSGWGLYNVNADDDEDDNDDGDEDETEDRYDDEDGEHDDEEDDDDDQGKQKRRKRTYDEEEEDDEEVEVISPGGRAGTLVFRPMK